jgi:PAS domain S-box-containing protein
VWFDWATPLGIAAGISYLLLVFCSLWFPRPGTAFLFAAIGTLLTFLGYFLSPMGPLTSSIVIANRILCIIALWVVAIVIYYSRRENVIRRQGEENLQLIVNTMLDGLITIDELSILHSFNPAATRIFGYQPEEVIGQDIKIIMPQTADIKNIIGPGREFSGRRKDGSIFPMELGVNEMRVTGSNSKRIFVGTIRDISERKRSEKAIEQYLVALKRSNQELDDFAYIASHDLKEPLRGLSNNAMFLKEDFGDKIGEEGTKRLNRITFLCERMERLVNDLLYFSRLGRQELAIQKTDLNEIIKDIIAMMESSLHESGAMIMIPCELPTITCDLPRITEVFRNLITNAVKYNDKPQKIIEIGHEIQNGNNVFYVRDNGIGIAPEFHSDVFRIFKRLNNESDEVKGTGVGLTFVKKIIERHNGRIWIESQPGSGATFYFTIQ